MKMKSYVKYAVTLLMVVLMMVGCSDNAQKNEKDTDTTTGENKQTNEKVIGIIGAMSEEVEILRGKMEIENTKKIAGMEFYQGTLDGENIVLVQSGIGKVNAAACAQILADHFGVDYLINSGVAGGLNPDVKVGDIVISTDAVQHDVDITALGEEPGVISRMETSVFTADEKLVQLAEESAKTLSEDIHVFKGRIASGDQFIASNEQREKIATTFAPYAVEMEGAAIAHVAQLNNIPFVIIRAISDDANGESNVTYVDFVKVAAENASQMMEQMIKGFSTKM